MVRPVTKWARQGPKRGFCRLALCFSLGIIIWIWKMQGNLQKQEVNLLPRPCHLQCSWQMTLTVKLKRTRPGRAQCLLWDSCFPLTGITTHGSQDLQAAPVTIRTRAACATCRPASPSIPSFPASDFALPARCCSAPWRSSRPSPCASCCACCIWRSWAWRRRAGRGQPGRWKFPCRRGWAVLGGLRSCSETSPGPWSWAGRAFRRCLGQNRGKKMFGMVNRLNKSPKSSKRSQNTQISAALHCKTDEFWDDLHSKIHGMRSSRWQHPLDFLIFSWGEERKKTVLQPILLENAGNLGPKPRKPV